MSSQAAENLFQPVADVYGFLRDEHGRALFENSPNADNFTGLFATDAKAIAEVDLPFGGIPGLEQVRTGIDTNGREYPHRYIITTPNMGWIPDISKYQRAVRMNHDTRFGYHDFSLWPQMYFPATRHLSFTRRRPMDSELATHPFAILWHDLAHSDFDYEPGTIFTDLGRISAPIIDQIFEFRRQLTSRIKALQAQPPAGIRDDEKSALRAAEEGIRLTSVCLRTAAQSYLMTHATFTLFQRHGLEGLACVEMLTVWAAKSYEDMVEVPFELVDPSVIGTVTASVQVAIDMAMLGVPVWLVRPPHLVSSHSIRIMAKEHPTWLRADIASVTPIAGMREYFIGPPTYGKNRACLALHLGHIHLGGRGEVYKDIIYVAVTSGPSTSAGPSAPAVPVVPAVLPAHPPVPYRVGPNDEELTKTAYTINPEKYRSPDVHFCPAILPNWKEALRTTSQDSKVIIRHDDARLLRGYALLDPYLLARDDRIGDRNLVVWLFLRSAWISQVTTSWAAGAQFPTSQAWRDFLPLVAQRMNFDWTTARPSSSTSSSDPHARKKRSGKKVAQSRNTAQETRTSVEASLAATFPLNLLPVIPKQDLYWRGNVVLTALQYDMRPLPIPNIVRAQVLWDLLEQNFRIELLATDRCVLPRSGMALAAATLRDDFVSQVFPSGSPVNTSMSEESVGARSLVFRVKYLNDFRRVVQSWGEIGKPLEEDRFRNIDKSTNLALIDELERLSFGIYCNTFFKYFGRAPTVPHIFPSSSQ